MQAIKWYGLAAEKGEPRAQSHLGWMFWEGKGMPQDALQAHMWINLAASQLSGEEGERVGKVRDFIASKLLPDQLMTAQEMARNLRIPRKSIADSTVIAISHSAAKRPPVPRQIDQPIRGPTMREGGRYSAVSA